MVIVHFQGKQLILPISHGDCTFQGKQLLLPISHGDCVHFQGKQLLLPILHGDCVHFRGSNCYCLFYMVIVYISGEATAIAYFTWRLCTF